MRHELCAAENTAMVSDDIGNILVSMYRQRRKLLPTTPQSLEDAFNQFTFSCRCCARYLHLIYCLLPSKTSNCYESMWKYIQKLCEKYNLEFSPKILLVDFEKAAHDGFLAVFPNSKIKCCKFHLGQSLFRKIQILGLRNEYMKNSEIRIWLKSFFGLAFLPCTEVSDAFADLMSITPEDQTILKFSDYVLETYIYSSIFPPKIWAEIPDNEVIRTTNAAELYHRHLKDQFYLAHCSVHIVIDVLLKLQSETY
ncbi:hypothetical protein AGLY_013148 [Aphis glycines]|uniref:MULE transposase domain-containing protein n=1 Tax=Aphis glycines TaxID=307491 RepID=A0A6G0T5U5_APHGL|nr:hypothetical protein AGLY_013148 [Aphis glycines]